MSMSKIVSAQDYTREPHLQGSTESVFTDIILRYDDKNRLERV